MNNGIEYYILDIETNGLMTGTHEICEVSVIRFSDRMQITRQVKVDNVQNSSLDALRIIQKTAEDLKKGISKQQLIQDIEGFLLEDNGSPESRCLVGHNIIGFDKKFLWHTWNKYNKFFPVNLYLDTLQMMRTFAKTNNMHKPKLTLGASCDLLGVKKTENSHNAKDDTQSCYYLFERLKHKVDMLSHIKRIPHGGEELQENDF